MVTTVLVTGGHGLLGKAVQRVVHQKSMEEWRWVFIDSSSDLTDAATCKHVFDEIKPNRVLHLAARVGGLFENQSKGHLFWRDNTLITTHVLMEAYNHNVERVLSCLSTCVFPTEKTEFTTKDLHVGEPHESNAGYAYAKRGTAILSSLLNRQLGERRYLCVSPCNLFGPYDHFGKDKAHVIPALIHQFAQSKTGTTPLRLRGTGKALRQFMHVDDFAQWLVDTTMNKQVPAWEHEIVAPTEEHSIKDIADILSQRYNRVYCFDGDKSADGQPRKYGKGTTPTMHKTFQERLLQVCDWYDEQCQTSSASLPPSSSTV